MIAFVEGTLISGGTEAVVAVGGGVGLDVQLSALAAERLPAPGETVRLWTHFAVREDHWALFGFLEAEERSMFRLLISVSGVGPKVALGMLSRASGRDIAAYLRTGDEKALASLPGIGKKSAARLVVELGQRVPEAGSLPGPGPASGTPGVTGLEQALAVLGAMGLTGVRAEQALLQARQNAEGIEEDLERWIKAALQHL